MLSPYEKIKAIVVEAGLAVTVNALQQVCFNMGHEMKHERNAPIAGDKVYSVGMALGDAVLAAKK